MSAHPSQRPEGHTFFGYRKDHTYACECGFVLRPSTTPIVAGADIAIQALKDQYETHLREIRGDS